MSSAFYVPEGGEFVSSELTRGPWDPGSQHAGPPAALIAPRARSGRDAGRAGSSAGSRSRSCARCRSRRCGSRSRSCAPAARSSCSRRRCSTARASALVRAHAWRLAERETEIPPGCRAPTPRRARTQAEEKPFFDTGWDVGYHTAMEYRFVSGSFRELGPATVWMRMRHPLVAGEEPTPAAARAGRRRLGQRGQRHARPRALHLHQRRPERPPAPAAGRRVGRAWTRSRCPSRTASASPTRRCTTSAGRSAAPCRPCSCASANLQLGSLPPDRPVRR